MQLRSQDRDYLARVDAWWGQLLPRVAPFLVSRGGPILLVQARPAGVSLLCGFVLHPHVTMLSSSLITDCPLHCLAALMGFPEYLRKETASSCT